MKSFKRIERLSDIVGNNILVEEAENILGDIDWIIDEGYYLEVYINPEGVKKGEPEKTEGFIRYIDKECSYGELLSIFHEGSVREETMTFALIPCTEDFFESIRKRSSTISTEIDLLRGKIA